MKHTRHTATGLSVKMGFTPRPNGTAVIDIVHNGEYESAIVTGPALDFAKAAYDAIDIDGYIALWQANCPRVQECEAA